MRMGENPPAPFPTSSAAEATGEQPAEKPERQSEPIASYPAEQNNLPFDVVVERLHIPDAVSYTHLEVYKRQNGSYEHGCR